MTNLALNILAAGIPKGPPTIFSNGTVVLTNSILATWLGSAIVIGFAIYAMRSPKLVPSGAQNFAEWIVESLADTLAGILGWEMTKKSFWFFGTVFIFIMSVNMLALVPGVGSIGWNEAGHASHEHIPFPLLRGVNADLNMTGAMAITFFVCWFYWSFSNLGFVGFMTHLFGSKMPGTLGWALFPVFIIVGCIETISIFFRPLSLSLRLFGNIYGGENLMEAMYNLCAANGVWYLSPILLTPFYFFELLVAFVQAMVFCLLTAAFTGTMVAHHDEGHGHDDDHAHIDDPAHAHAAKH